MLEFIEHKKNPLGKSRSFVVHGCKDHGFLGNIYEDPIMGWIFSPRRCIDNGCIRLEYMRIVRFMTFLT